MTWRAHDPHGLTRSTGRILLATVGLTIVGFVTAILLTEWSARGIREAALSIAHSSAPSIEHLSSLRAELRRLEVLMDDYTERVAAGFPVPNAREDIRASRTRMHEEWRTYQQLPVYPGEEELWGPISGGLRDVDEAINGIFSSIDGARMQLAVGLLDDVLKPRVERTDATIERAVAFHAQEGQRIAQTIASRRARSSRLAMTLVATSLTLALLAALLAHRVVRQNTALLEDRASEMEEFAGRVAHDIRGPLSAVALALAAIRRRRTDNHVLENALARADRSVGRVGSIIDGLLAFALAGARPAPDAHVDVAPTVQAVVDGLAARASENDVEVRVEPVPHCELACQPGILDSLLANLVSNAIKFTDGGAIRRVTIRVLEHSRSARIEVEDTGPGLPAGQECRIFAPFVRLRREAPGIGLGLATVRRLAEAHGGGVGVQSTPGKGSLFWIELPKAESR